jgi:hypothetical protein
MKNVKKVVLCCEKPSNLQMFFGFSMDINTDDDKSVIQQKYQEAGFSGFSTDLELLKGLKTYRDVVISLGINVGEIETKSHDDWQTVILESQNGLPS